MGGPRAVFESAVAAVAAVERTVSQHPQPCVLRERVVVRRSCGAHRAPPSGVVRPLRAPTPQVRCVSPPLLRAPCPSGVPALPSRCLLRSSVPAPGGRAGVGTRFPRAAA